DALEHVLTFRIGEPRLPPRREVSGRISCDLHHPLHRSGEGADERARQELQGLQFVAHRAVLAQPKGPSMSLLLSLAAVPVFAAAGWVRDGALEWGATHPTRFVALVLLVIGAALAVARPEALWVALAFAPGIWWAPRHGDSIRFGENGDFQL